MEDITIDDPINVTGMGLLVASAEGKDFDPQELESQIINGERPVSKKTNLSDEFAKEMERFTQTFSTSSTSSIPSAHSSSAKTLQSSQKADEAEGEMFSVDDLLRTDTAAVPAYNDIDTVNDISDPRLADMTREEKKQAVITEVFKGLKDQPEFSIEKEREDDEKSRMLEQISFLRETLEEEGEDLSRVSNVTLKNTRSEIESVLKLLFLKNDRKRCCSFAEECILIGAHGMEWAFNGKKEYFGTKPDMTDWHKSVQVKLRRMRHDTSTVVQSIMQAYNLGSGARILLELIPSMLLYSRMRKSQHGDSLTVTDDEFNAGVNQMRNIETGKNE